MPGSAFLRGDDVTLRTIEEGDTEFLRDLINAPDVWPYLDNHLPQNRNNEHEFVTERVTDDESVNLLICVGREGKEPSGVIGFGPTTAVSGSAELGIMLTPEYWGEGYGTEASRLLTTFAFEERRMHRMVAKAIDENIGSCRIWEKLGFRQEAHLKEAAYHQGQYMDLLLYAVLEDEWE